MDPGPLLEKIQEHISDPKLLENLKRHIADNVLDQHIDNKSPQANKDIKSIPAAQNQAPKAKKRKFKLSRPKISIETVFQLLGSISLISVLSVKHGFLFPLIGYLVLCKTPFRSGSLLAYLCTLHPKVARLKIAVQICGLLLYPILLALFSGVGDYKNMLMLFFIWYAVGVIAIPKIISVVIRYVLI